MNMTSPSQQGKKKWCMDIPTNTKRLGNQPETKV